MNTEQSRQKKEKIRGLICSKLNGVDVVELNGENKAPLDIEWYHNLQDVEAIQLNNKGPFSAVFVEGKDGVVIPAHYHERKEIVYMMYGKARDVISGREVEEGDVVTISAKQLHGFELMSDSGMIIKWR